MPRDFYPDTVQPEDQGSGNENDLCLVQTEMFDGPGVCTRKKGHRVDEMSGANAGTGEFHQENLEGWVWDSNGSFG